MVTPKGRDVNVDRTMLRKMLDQVLDWNGTRPSFAPTLEQRYLVEFDGSFVSPNFDVWATQQN